MKNTLLAAIKFSAAVCGAFLGGTLVANAMELDPASIVRDLTLSGVLLYIYLQQRVDRNEDRKRWDASQAANAQIMHDLVQANTTAMVELKMLIEERMK